MQIVPRYLVNNRTTLIANEAGYITEYKPVYSRQLKVFTNIDNTLEFRVLNSDQKPIDISDYTLKFQAFDENKNLLIEHDGTAIVGDDSAVTRGLFKVVITENDLLNVKSQFLSYSIHLVDSANQKILTYAENNFEGCGSIKIDTCQYPGPIASKQVTTFSQASDAVWNSSTINAEPGINGNEALHTSVIYTDNYVGDVTVQATLETNITDSTDWADVSTVSFDGTETEPTPVNFNGVYGHLRFKATSNPANKLTKILVRN